MRRVQWQNCRVKCWGHVGILVSVLENTNIILNHRSVACGLSWQKQYVSQVAALIASTLGFYVVHPYAVGFKDILLFKAALAVACSPSKQILLLGVSFW